MSRRYLLALVTICLAAYGGRPLRALGVMAAAPIAVGTLTVSTSAVGYNQREIATRVTMAWTADASGAVSGHAFALRTGHLLAVEFTPGTGGTVPTDLYGVTLVDSRGIDLLHGHGADQSATVSTRYTFDPPLFHDLQYTVDLVIANAGNAKTGTVTVWVQ